MASQLQTTQHGGPGLDRNESYPGVAPGVAPGAAPSAPAPPAPAPAPPVPAAQPAPQSSLGSDPAYLAFVRSLGLSEADAQAAAQQATARAQARLANTSADIARQGVLGRGGYDPTTGLEFAGIQGRLESRGLLKSGELVRDLAIQRASEAARQSALQQMTAEQLAQIQTGLALQQQSAGQRLAEAGLSYAPRQVLANG